MRFKQLAKKENIVVRKHLRKSHHGWVIAFTLSLALGASIIMTSSVVKADTTSANQAQTELTASQSL